MVDGVGLTAWLTAAGRALEAQKPCPLASDIYAGTFCRAAGGVWQEVVNGSAPNHLLHTEFGSRFVDFQGARTRYFDDLLRRYHHTQVVIPAAGLDTRAYRLTWHPEVTVYELDQPNVIKVKRDVLASNRIEAQVSRIVMVETNLCGNWWRPLLSHGFNPEAPSTWIVEGLLIYLPCAARVALFQRIDDLAALGSCVAVEDSAPLDPELFAAKLDNEIRGGGEPFYQLLHNESGTPAAEWFRKWGWKVEETPVATYLRDVGRPPPPPEIARDTLVTAVKE